MACRQDQLARRLKSCGYLSDQAIEKTLIKNFHDSIIFGVRWVQIQNLMRVEAWDTTARRFSSKKLAILEKFY